MPTHLELSEGLVDQGIFATLGAVLATVVVSAVYGLGLNLTRDGALTWSPIAEGLLTGAAAIAVWQLARSRIAATTGLGLLTLLLATGAAGGFGPASAFVQLPMGWALVVVLMLRVARPRPAPETAESASHPSP